MTFPPFVFQASGEEELEVLLLILLLPTLQLTNAEDDLITDLRGFRPTVFFCTLENSAMQSRI